MSKNESVFHHILNKPKNEQRVDKTSRRETIRDEIWIFLEAGSIVLTTSSVETQPGKGGIIIKPCHCFQFHLLQEDESLISTFNTNNINWQQMTWLKYKCWWIEPGGGGGTPRKKLGRGVRPAAQNPLPYLWPKRQKKPYPLGPHIPI